MTRRQPSNEFEILLRLGHVALADEDRKGLKLLLRNEVDWDALLSAAIYHRLIPLAYEHLRDLPSAVPEAHLQRFRDAALGIQMINARLLSSLRELCELFEGEQLAHAVIKGPVTAVSLYGDVGRRVFTDIDIVIMRADIERAYKCMLDAGYSPFSRLSEAWRRQYVRGNAACTFHRLGGLDTVDVHWSLHRPSFGFSASAEEVWDRRVAIDLGSLKTKTLGPEDTLIYLCSHATRHEWRRLAWLVDVSELLRSHADFDWDWILRWSLKRGCHRMLYLGLFLANQLLHAPVPDDVLSAAQVDPTVRRVAKHVMCNLKSVEYRRVPAPWKSILNQTSIFYQTLNRRDRLYLIYRVFFEPEPVDWNSFPMPAFMAPVYHVVRPCRLVAKRLNWRGGRVAEGVAAP